MSKSRYLFHKSRKCDNQRWFLRCSANYDYWWQMIYLCVRFSSVNTFAGTSRSSRERNLRRTLTESRSWSRQKPFSWSMIRSACLRRWGRSDNFFFILDSQSFLLLRWHHHYKWHQLTSHVDDDITSLWHSVVDFQLSIPQLASKPWKSESESSKEREGAPSPLSSSSSNSRWNEWC